MIVPPLSPPQLRAATSSDRLCYVKAGPGSGKTFTAAEAIGYLSLVRYRDDPRGICGVTFARSARRELTTRIQRRWGSRYVQWPNLVGTFDEIHRRLLRYLIHRGLLEWPGGGTVPDVPEDTWASQPNARASVRSVQRRFRLALDDEGVLVTRETRALHQAPNPAFIDGDELWGAIASGHCTHTDVRNVMGDAVDEGRHPMFNQAFRECLAGSFSHLVIDEAFDMNPLDIAVVERAIEAGLSVTVVGDPWQSLYEFRGSTPKLVSDVIKRHRFAKIDMPGDHRYQTQEMRELAQSLFDEKPFSVLHAEDGDEFDVVLAHDWGTLWNIPILSLLPAGKPSKVDGGLMANAFLLLLGALTQEHFGIEASGVAEARRTLGSHPGDPRLQPALDALTDLDQDAADIWNHLRDGFQASGQTWPPQKAIAEQCMQRVVTVVRQEGKPILGLTVHQAKGLEWHNVLFLDPSLVTTPGWKNVMSIDAQSHRSVYVALTRAKSMLRIGTIPADRFGTPHSPIIHVQP